jgi:hypothetical protein
MSGYRSRRCRANDNTSRAFALKDGSPGELTMDQPITDVAPTSTAATSETEPEIVAGISSAEGGPDQPTSFHIAGIEFPYARTVMLLAGGLALGYGLSRLLWRAPR